MPSQPPDPVAANLRVYPYHAKPAQLVVPIVMCAVFGTGALLLGFLFPLAPGVKIMCVVLPAVLFVLMAVLCILVQRIRTSSPRLVFSETRLLLPRSPYSAKTVVIEYADIVSADTIAGNEGRVLRLKQKDGRRRDIRECYMTSSAAFDEVWSIVDLVLTSGTIPGMAPGDYRVLCPDCGNPVAFSESQQHQGKCCACALLTSADHRKLGIVLAVIGLLFVLVGGAIAFATSLFGHTIHIPVGFILCGLIAIACGLYSLFTGKASRGPF